MAGDPSKPPVFTASVTEPSATKLVEASYPARVRAPDTRSSATRGPSPSSANGGQGLDAKRRTVVRAAAGGCAGAGALGRLQPIHRQQRTATNRFVCDTPRTLSVAPTRDQVIDVAGGLVRQQRDGALAASHAAGAHCVARAGSALRPHRKAANLGGTVGSGTQKRGGTAV